MAKTAEEILRKHEPVLFDKDLGVQDMVTVICAMNEFAAQEVEEYKRRLKRLIGDQHYSNSSMAKLSFQQIIELIDTVK